MTIVNGLPKSRDTYIRGICSRRKLIKFSRLWEECAQEEARLGGREEKLSDDEDQALAAQFRKGKNKKKNHLLHRRSFKSLVKVRKTILSSNVIVVKMGTSSQRLSSRKRGQSKEEMLGTMAHREGGR